MAKENAKSMKNSESGYWLYSDGTVYWGIALARNEEIPIKVIDQIKPVSEEDQKNGVLPFHKGPADERIAYHKSVIEASQKAEAEAKAKEKELADKNAKALKK